MSGYESQVQYDQMMTVIYCNNVRTMVMNYWTEIVTCVYDKQELHE